MLDVLHPLGAGNQGVAVLGRVVMRQCSFGLHRGPGQHRIGQFNVLNMVRLGKGLLQRRGIAQRPVHGHVAWGDGLHQHCTGCHRRLQVGHACQWFIVDLNQLGRIHGLLQGLCSHQGHGFAHMAHLFMGQDRHARAVHVVAVAAFEHHQGHDGAQPRLGHVFGGDHPMNALGLQGGLGVDGADARMRPGAAHKTSMQLGGHGNVAGVGAFALNQFMQLIVIARLGAGKFVSGVGHIRPHAMDK